MGKVIGKSSANDIEDGAINKDKINSDVAGAGLTGGSGSAIDVNVDNSSIEINTDKIQIKNDGIKDNHIDFGTGAGQVAAIDLPYDNSVSVLTAGQTQEALDEVSDIITPSSATPPPNPFDGKRWLDTSVTPNSLKIYKNGNWYEEEKFDTTTNEITYDGGSF